MSFLNEVGNFDFSENEINISSLLPEGEQVVTIVNVEEKASSTGGRILELTIKNSSGIFGKLRFNTANANRDAIRISIKEFNNLLIQLNDDDQKNFLMYKDTRYLLNAEITIFVKHKIYKDRKIADCKPSLKKAIEIYQLKKSGDNEPQFSESPF